MIGQVRKVTRVESFSYLAMGKIGLGPCPQDDLSSPSISMVMWFRLPDRAVQTVPGLSSLVILLVMWARPP